MKVIKRTIRGMTTQEDFFPVEMEELVKKDTEQRNALAKRTRAITIAGYKIVDVPEGTSLNTYVG